MNESTQAVSHTGIEGVSRARNGKYFARMMHDSELMHLGTFDTIEEAKAVRDAAFKYLKGETQTKSNRGMKRQITSIHDALEFLKRKYPKDEKDQRNEEQLSIALEEDEIPKENKEASKITIKITIYIDEKEVMTKIL